MDGPSALNTVTSVGTQSQLVAMPGDSGISVTQRLESPSSMAMVDSALPTPGGERLWNDVKVL